MRTITTITNLLLKISTINKEEYEPDIVETAIEEDEVELKMDFDIVKNEVKQAAQEAISKSTIKQYQRYNNNLQNSFSILINQIVYGVSLNPLWLNTLRPIFLILQSKRFQTILLLGYILPAILIFNKANLLLSLLMH